MSYYVGVKLALPTKYMDIHIWALKHSFIGPRVLSVIIISVCVSCWQFPQKARERGRKGERVLRTERRSNCYLFVSSTVTRLREQTEHDIYTPNSISEEKKKTLLKCILSSIHSSIQPAIQPSTHPPIHSEREWEIWKHVWKMYVQSTSWSAMLFSNTSLFIKS